MRPNGEVVVKNMTALRIPMRGYEVKPMTIPYAGWVVTNPHEGL